ncbi:hypothetical protein [Nanchangia anserum]|uniref:hypothetical protein n=1 Tax=Nanchangia anserum TaxID=2692125 RepID=UPI001D11BAD1|nr:hypothetical protein [Nanchangia anserum]
MRRLDDIFDLRYGQSLELNSLTQVDAPDGVNFVSRARGNNGVTARVLPPGDVGRAGEITVALSGGVLSSFVQPEDFVTGFHVMILTAKDPAMTLVEKLWWCRCIWENRRRFSYGRQANRTLGSLLMPEACPGWASAKEVPSNDALADGYQSRISLARRNTWLDFRLDETVHRRRASESRRRIAYLAPPGSSAPRKRTMASPISAICSRSSRPGR